MSSWSEEIVWRIYHHRATSGPVWRHLPGSGDPISSTVPVWAAASGPSGSQLLYGDAGPKYLEVGRSSRTTVTVRYRELRRAGDHMWHPNSTWGKGAVVRIREHSSIQRRMQLYVDTPNHAGGGSVWSRHRAHAELFSWLIVDQGVWETETVEAGRVSSSRTTIDAFQWLSVDSFADWRHTCGDQPDYDTFRRRLDQDSASECLAFRI